MSPAATAVVPQQTGSNLGTSASFGYEFTRTIRMSSEELRIQRLHDIANIFESAFGGAQ